MKFKPAPGTSVPEGTFTCSECEWYGGVESRAFPGRHLDCIDFEAELTKAASRDTEIAHLLADNILVDIIRWGYCIGELDDRDVASLIDLYDAVPKWYA